MPALLTSKALLMSLPIVSVLSISVFCNPHTQEITENQGAFQTGQDSPPSRSEESKGQLSRADDCDLTHSYWNRLGERKEHSLLGGG